MSQTVDNRIVEMRFDNKQFEAGAKQTMGTLGKLKEALKLPETGKALEGLDKASKSIKLDGISAGIEALERRFSTLGIVGMRVIENITDGLMNKVSAAVNFVSDGIVSGGIKRAMNIENAHFQLQALLKDETRVQAVMADAMESVDGTAYAYDEAAKAAAQFAASGIQAGDEMLGALKGITGVAAMTNSSFEDISRIFTTVAGNGRLMGDQLLQLSGRGLNAASTLADYFREVRGEAGMTEAAIREMVSDGKIGFKDFSDAMTWAFGDSAKRANETFTGAMSNMKSALARIGAGFISPLVEQNGEIVKLFNALRIKINDVKSALVFDEQRSAIAGLADVTKMSKTELDEMFKTIKTNGTVSISDLDTLSKKGADAYGALTKYVNGVNDGSIRASYAITSALGELTNGTKVSTADIKRFVEEGKIDLATFTSAMEAEFGTEKTLSKQFTDWFLDHVHGVVEAINAADMTKPMEIFYYWVEGVKNVAKGLLSVLSPVGKAFASVFLNFSADDVISFSKAVGDLTSKMKLSESGSKNLHDAFKGIFDIVALLGDGFISLLRAIEKPVISLGGGLLGLAGNAGRALSQFAEWARNSKTISKAYDFVSFGVEKASIWLDSFVRSAWKFTDSVKNFPLVQKVINAVSEAIGNLGGVAEKFEFRNVLDLLLGVIKKSGPIAMTIVKGLGDAFTFLLNSVSKALGTGGFNSIYDLFNVVVLSGIGIQLSKFIENINKTVSGVKATVKSAGGFLGSIKSVISGVTKTFDELQSTLKAETLKKIAVSLALIAGSIFVLSMIDSEKLTGSLGAVSVLLGELTGIFVLLNKMDKNKNAVISSMGALISMAASILILSSALKKISDIDSEKLLGSLSAITALLVEMTGVAIVLSKYGGKVKTGVVGIIAFSTAIYILSSAVRKLGELDVEVLKKGLISVGALLAELSAFMIGSKFGQLKASQAVGIVILSASLLILQKAVEGFGSMNTEKLLTGIIAVGAVLTEIAAFSLAAGESKHILRTSVSLVIMAKALGMLEKPMTVFGNMELSQIGKGLLAMGGALAEITLAMRLLPKNALTIGVGLVATAEALKIIGDVVLKMSGMSLEEIAKGMVTLGGSMAILSVSMNAMKGTLGASAAMLVMSASLAIFVPVLKSLASMSWTEIAKGLVSLAGGFAVVGAAGALLSPVIPAMLGLAGAMALLGVAAAAVGVGVLALSVGLTTLAASGVAGAAALAEVNKILVVGFLNSISNSASALGRAVKTLVLTACDVLVECFPTIAKTVLVLVKEVLTALADNASEIVTQLLKLIIGIIDALAADLPTVIRSVVNLFMQFFAGLIQALKGMDIKTLVEGIAGIGLISALMLALSAMASLAPSAMSGVLAMGVVIAELAVVLAAIGALAQIPGLNWLIGKGGELLQGVGTAIGKFIGGIIGGVLGGISAQIPKIGTDLSDFMTNLQPFIEGSKNIDAGVLASVGFLSAIIVALTVAEVINGITSLYGLSLVDMAVELSNFMIALQPFIENSRQLSAESMQACGYLAAMIITLTAAELLSGIGKFFGLSGSIVDFGKELSEFGPYIKKFADDVKDVKPEAVQGAASAAEIMANVAKKLPATGGLVQKLFGEKSLSEFGQELVKFGPSIKQFGEQVKDVKPAAVEGAAAAAEIMANLANKLPAQGGLAQKIFGERSISEFGEELVKFGPKIAQFAEQVKNVNPAAVTGAAIITTIMTDLANNLPSSDTLWDKIFGGGQVTLSEFGEELVKFGTSMSSFSASISGINVEQVNGAITSFKDLIDLATYVQGTSATDLVNFSNQLAQVGVDSVDKFVQAFAAAGPKATTAINSLLSAVVSAITAGGASVQSSATTVGNNLCTGIQTGITSKQPSVIATETTLATTMTNTLKNALPIANFNIIGQNVVQGLINGINVKKPLALSTVKNLCTSIINQFKVSLPQSTLNTIGQNVVQGLINGINVKKPLALSTVGSLCAAIINKFRTDLSSSTFKTFGENIVTWLIQGMDSNKSAAQDSAAQICNVIVEAFRTNLSESKFREIGANAALGLKNGIESKIDEIGQAAVKAAQKAVNSAKSALDEHSPSKVMAKVGEFFSLGLANGIIDQIKAIALAGTRAANEAIDPVKQAVDGITSIIDSGNFDVDPVIRPVVDLSDVQRGAKEIGALMNQTYDLSSVYDKVMDVSSSFDRARKSRADSEAATQNTGEGNKFEFNQYNYSPKALTRSEIYRQTNNQFSAFRKAVNTT